MAERAQPLPAQTWAIKHHVQKRLSTAFWFAAGLGLAFLFFFPLYFMISSSFKAEVEVLSVPVHWFPQDFQGLENYRRAFDAVPLGRFFANSTLMATVDVIVTVFFSALAGYGFAKYHFPGRQVMFFFMLTLITIPFQILLVPLFMEIRRFGWDDSYYGLIVPGVLNAFGVFMMRQFAYSIPDEMLDAARIDGASEFRIFLQIVFPLLAPASASLALIIFLFSWNNFLWPLVVIRTEELQTIPVGLTAFTQAHTREPQWAVAMAVSSLATLPVALLFIFFQRYFIEGIILSGMKG